jgi:hypothetical protein
VRAVGSPATARNFLDNVGIAAKDPNRLAFAQGNNHDVVMDCRASQHGHQDATFTPALLVWKRQKDHLTILRTDLVSSINSPHATAFGEKFLPNP